MKKIDKFSKLNPKNRQRGVGLVELMVAIAISLFLLLGLATTFYNMKNTSLSRQGLSEVEIKERVASTYIANAVRTVGQFTQPCVASTPTVPINCTSSIGSKFIAVSPFSAGQVLNGTSSATPGTDTISTRFVSIDSTDIVGCGGPTVAGALYADTFNVDVSGNLVCTEAQNGGATQSYTLATGVAGMQVIYGVAIENLTDPYSNNTVAKYYPTSTMTSTLWADVKTVNVMLAFLPANKTTCTLPSTWPSTWATSSTNKCVMISRLVTIGN